MAVLDPTTSAMAQVDGNAISSTLGSDPEAFQDFICALGGLRSRPVKELLRWIQQRQAEADVAMALRLEELKQQQQKRQQQLNEEYEEMFRPLSHLRRQNLAMKQRIIELEGLLFAEHPPCTVPDMAAFRASR
jgi:hypothetical protein